MKILNCAHLLVFILIPLIYGDIPGCDYFDTVDLTNAHSHGGYYKYHGTNIPMEKSGIYNYQILFNGKRVLVPDHIRGCACHIKSCVRFCCDPQSVIKEKNWTCIKEYIDYSKLTLNITLNNGSEIDVNPFEHFTIQNDFDMTCKDMYFLDNSIEDELWTLFENGLIYREGVRNVGKQKYCLQPLNGQSRIVPIFCSNDDDDRTLILFTLIVSEVFLLFTIAVHIVSQIRNRHITFCISYFICLALSLAISNLNKPIQPMLTEWQCFAYSCLGYYASMAMFLWLLTINYSFWKLLTKFEEVGFWKGNLFVWVGAGILLLITALVDILVYKDVSDEKIPEFYLWKPGLAYFSCWIKTEDWSAMMYFYGPIAIFLLISISFFTLTVWDVYWELKRHFKVWKKGNANKKNKASFLNFLRLFISAGLIWSIEVFTYLTGDSWLDFVTCAQGVIIFTATVSRKEVHMALQDRFFKDCHNRNRWKIRSNNQNGRRRQ